MIFFDTFTSQNILISLFQRDKFQYISSRWTSWMSRIWHMWHTNCDSPFKKHRSKNALFQGWVLMWRHFCAIRVSVLCTKNNLVEANLFSGGLVVGSLDSNYSENWKTKPFLTTSSSGCTYHRTKSVILDFSTFFSRKNLKIFLWTKDNVLIFCLDKVEIERQLNDNAL